MLNVYPWGLSLNHVRPLAPDRTRVVYRGYVRDAAMSGRGAGGALDRVEIEDEAVVAAVQRGVRARLYRGGRYSVTHERGVHHFHRLLAAALVGRRGRLTASTGEPVRTTLRRAGTGRRGRSRTPAAGRAGTAPASRASRRIAQEPELR
jgi:hypothetical protein